MKYYWISQGGNSSPMLKMLDAADVQWWKDTGYVVEPHKDGDDLRDNGCIGKTPKKEPN